MQRTEQRRQSPPKFDMRKLLLLDHSPQPVKQLLGQLNVRLDPYEELYAEVRQMPDALALLDIMDVAGVFNAELFATIRTQAAELVRQGNRSFAQMEQREIDGGPSAKLQFEQEKDHQNKQVAALRDKLIRHKRYLTLLFIEELRKTVFDGALQHNLTRYGFDINRREISEQFASGQMPDDFRKLFDWYDLAERVTHQTVTEPLPPAPFTADESYQFFRDSDFHVTTIDHAGFIPEMTLNDLPVRIQLDILSDQHPFILFPFTLCGVHEELARGYISRITGEMVVDGTLTVPASNAFKQCKKGDLYSIVRNRILDAASRAYELGKLQDRTYITPRVQPESVSTPIMETSEVSEIPTESLPPPLAKLPMESAPVAPVEVAAEKKIRIERYESRLSWRRIVRALERIEYNGTKVTMDTGSKHPKFKLGTKTSRFLNSHDTDPQHAKREVQRVLQELGDIPEELFWQQLK